VLHVLPPCCPDHNRIERPWQELHANVTRDHLTSRTAERLIPGDKRPRQKQDTDAPSCPAPPRPSPPFLLLDHGRAQNRDTVLSDPLVTQTCWPSQATHCGRVPTA
jgi:hypothetical protein